MLKSSVCSTCKKNFFFFLNQYFSDGKSFSSVFNSENLELNVGFYISWSLTKANNNSPTVQVKYTSTHWLWLDYHLLRFTVLTEDNDLNKTVDTIKLINPSTFHWQRMNSKEIPRITTNNLNTTISHYSASNSIQPNDDSR